MNAVVMTASLRLDAAADMALKAAGRFWFLTAVAGQWIFVYYNVVVAGHLLYAAVITVGGPLQLVPQVRARFPVFHRWNGRLYLLAGFTMAVSSPAFL